MKAKSTPQKNKSKKPAAKKETGSKKKPAKTRAAKKSVAKKAKKRTPEKLGVPKKKLTATNVPRTKAGPPELPQTGEVLIVPDPVMEDDSPSARALLDRRKSADRREYDRRAFPRPEGRRSRMGRRTGDDT